MQRDVTIMRAGGRCIFITPRKNIFIRPYKNILIAPCGSTYKREQSRIEEATRCGNLGRRCLNSDLKFNNEFAGIFQRSILSVSLIKSGLKITESRSYSRRLRRITKDHEIDLLLYVAADMWSAATNQKFSRHFGN